MRPPITSSPKRSLNHKSNSTRLWKPKVVARLSSVARQTPIGLEHNVLITEIMHEDRFDIRWVDYGWFDGAFFWWERPIGVKPIAEMSFRNALGGFRGLETDGKLCLKPKRGRCRNTTRQPSNYVRVS